MDVDEFNTEEPEFHGVSAEHLRRQYHDISDHKRLVLTVYRDVWDEFYRWEGEDATTTIDMLARQPNEMVDSKELDADETMNLDVDMPGCIVCTHYNNYDDAETVSYYPCDNIPFKSSLNPHPAYQSCVPISRNLRWREGEPDEMYTVSFIPYEDENGFDASEYLSKFTHSVFEWKHLEDPDHEMILLETIRRLHALDLSFQDIDDTKVLPQRTRNNHEDGILWSCSQRDQIRWPGNSLSNLEEPQISATCEFRDIKGRVNSVLRTFCPSLSCIESRCPVHVEPYPDLRTANAPTKTSGSFWTFKDGKPCEYDCFRREKDDFLDKISADLDDATSRTIIELFPDLMPCDLAVICKKSCREIFVLRCHLFPDHKISGQKMDSRLESRDLLAKFEFADAKSKKKDNGRNDQGAEPDELNVEEKKLATPLWTGCDHQGTCFNSGCACFIHKLHCQRSCRCDKECILRWKGCKCKSKHGTKDKACGPRCRCRSNGRECDPELCKSCKAKDGIAAQSNKRFCSNVQIQRENPAILEVKEGSVGLGAFATHVIQVDDYIGEYTGEFYAENIGEFRDEPEEESQAADASLLSRDFIRKYKNLNYLFELNASQSLDSDRVGNETRYMNHAQDANVGIEVVMVNNEHRIKFTALKKIARGQELFINYGDLYWIGDSEPIEFKSTNRKK